MAQSHPGGAIADRTDTEVSVEEVYIDSTLLHQRRRSGVSTITIRHPTLCYSQRPVIPLNTHRVTAARGTRTVVTPSFSISKLDKGVELWARVKAIAVVLNLEIEITEQGPVEASTRTDIPILHRGYAQRGHSYLLSSLLSHLTSRRLSSRTLPSVVSVKPPMAESPGTKAGSFSIPTALSSFVSHISLKYIAGDILVASIINPPPGVDLVPISLIECYRS